MNTAHKIALDQRLIETEPAPPVYALSALRPEIWDPYVTEAAEGLAAGLRDLDAYGETVRPFDGSDALNEHRDFVRRQAAHICSVVYANSDATIDEEDIDHAATVASWILGRKVEVSGWMS